MVTNDLNGQALRRDEADNNYSAGDPHEIWYRFGGRQLGFTGNNPVLSACLAGSRRGTLETDYQASAESRTKTTGTGAFRSGATIATG